MKPLVPVACVAVGIAIGWFARPMADAKNPAPVAGNSSGRSSSGTLGTPEAPSHGPERTSSGRPSKPENSDAKAKVAKVEITEANKEAIKTQQDKMTKQMTDVQRRKFEARLAKLATDLNLSPEQVEKIRAGMETRFAKMGDMFSFDGSGTPEDQKKKLEDITALMKTDGLDEATSGLLTDEQKEQYAAFKGKERQNRIESRALKDLGNITSVLELTPEQRDGVYDVLASQAATREDKPNGTAMMNMFSESMGIQMDDELGLQEMMQEQMEAGISGDIEKATSESSMADMRTRMRDTIKQRTDAKVEALRPHLTETQLKQYREHLEAKGSGMLNMFGGAGDGDEKK